MHHSLLTQINPETFYNYKIWHDYAVLYNTSTSQTALGLMYTCTSGVNGPSRHTQ